MTLHTSDMQGPRTSCNPMHTLKAHRPRIPGKSHHQHASEVARSHCQPHCLLPPFLQAVIPSAYNDFSRGHVHALHTPHTLCLLWSQGPHYRVREGRPSDADGSTCTTRDPRLWRCRECASVSLRDSGGSPPVPPALQDHTSIWKAGGRVRNQGTQRAGASMFT